MIFFQLPQNELHCYQLSTAENELGVVVAKAAESGALGKLHQIQINQRLNHSTIFIQI